jgi:hypothetical protein
MDVNKIKLGTVVVLDDVYEIRTVVTDMSNEMPYGDVYDSIAELKQNHPNEDWKFGFVIVNRETGLIPDDEYALKEFYETIEDAMYDYADIIVGDISREPFAGLIN